MTCKKLLVQALCVCLLLVMFPRHSVQSGSVKRVVNLMVPILVHTDPNDGDLYPTGEYVLVTALVEGDFWLLSVAAEVAGLPAYSQMFVLGAFARVWITPPCDDGWDVWLRASGSGRVVVSNPTLHHDWGSFQVTSNVATTQATDRVNWYGDRLGKQLLANGAPVLAGSDGKVNLTLGIKMMPMSGMMMGPICQNIMTVAQAGAQGMTLQIPAIVATRQNTEVVSAKGLYGGQIKVVSSGRPMCFNSCVAGLPD